MSANHGALAAAVSRAVLRHPAYADHLARAGWREADGYASLPVIDKAVVFSEGLSGWMGEAPLAAGTEAMTSSGHGGVFSLGLSAPEADARVEAAAAEVLGLLGVDAPLLLTCLPAGIHVEATGCVRAACGTNVEAALSLLEALGRRQGAALIAAEPLLAKELIERAADAGILPERVIVASGGEWPAEALRVHLEELLGPGGAVIWSFGAAELGINQMVELPALRALRGALHRDPALRVGLLGEDPGFAPILYAPDPERLLAEEIRGVGPVPALALTTLEERPLNLVRYLVGDRGRVLEAGRVEQAMAQAGIDGPLGVPAVVAHYGRMPALSDPAEGPSPEQVKEWLFGIPSRAGALSGRFLLNRRGPGEVILELQESLCPRAGSRAPSRIEAQRALGVTELRIHAHDRYRHHQGGHERKTRYLPAARS